MKRYNPYSSFDFLIDEYLLVPDKYVFPFVIKEKSKERQIITYNSGADYGVRLRKYHENIADDFYNNFCDRNCNSFAYHKNVRTLDALQDHLKSTHFIKLDIHHFFESITESTFFEIYGYKFNSKWKRLLSACFYKDSLSIGFVTSPMISDFFMSNVDDKVQEYLSKNKKLHYSRYCDDILISSEEENDKNLEGLFSFIQNELQKLHLEINEKKTQKVSLDYDDHNSISFLGLAISRLTEDLNKITISKRYILFLLQLIHKSNRYKDSCKGLLDEINSRVGYLYYNSIISYERFQKKYENIYGTRYNFVPKKPIDRKASDFAKEIPEWDKYLKSFKLKLHGKAVDGTSGAITANDSVILEKFIGEETEIEIPKFIDAIGPSAFENSNIRKVVCSERLKSIGDCAFRNSNLEEIVLSKKLRSIGAHAFESTLHLRNIVIPEKIKKIPTRTFSSSGIRTITLPAGLTEIHESAFSGSNLRSIVIPDSVNVVNRSAFEDCYFLNDVVLSKSLLAIDNNVFANCYSLKNISFPDSVLSINADAFHSCLSFKELYIPKNIVNICQTAFKNCQRLEKLTISEENQVYDSRDNSNTIIETSLNKIIYLIKNSTIPESVEIIGNGLFSNTNIKEFVLSKNVKRICRDTFRNCKLLQKVTINGSLEAIESSAFAGCSSLKEINIPESCIEFGDNAFADCYRLEKFNLPKNTKFIGSKAFKNIPNIEFEIPTNLEFLGQQAFSKCYSMRNIYIPASLTSIGAFAFSGLSKVIESIEVDPLNKVYRSHNNCIIERKTNTIILGCKNSIIDKDIANIGDYAFEGCKDLKHVEFGPSFERIGKYSFRGCSNIEKIEFKKLYSIGAYAFANCRNLKEIALPDSVDTLGDNSFEGCVSLKKIVLPNSVTNFGTCTFKNCRSIESIHLPSSYVDPFDYSLFEGCDNVKEIKVSSENAYYLATGNCLINSSNGLLVYGCGDVSIPRIVTDIGPEAFAYCQTIKKVVIPKTVKTIKEKAFFKSSIEEIVFETNNDELENTIKLVVLDYAFAGCTNLRKISFPSSTTYFYKGVFESCFSLKEININSFLHFVGENAFKDCRNLESVTLSKGIAIIASGMFERTAIKSIDLSYVLNIGNKSFRSCSQLKDVKFLAELQKVSIVNSSDYSFNGALIGGQAFENCDELISADLSNVTNIGYSAFQNCKKLSDVKLINFSYLRNSKEIDLCVDLGMRAFANCSSLTSIEFNHTASIGIECFKDTHLNNVKFNEHLSKIDSFAFANNENIKSIEIPENLQTIGNSPFIGCKNLSNVTVAKENKSFFVFDNAVYNRQMVFDVEHVLCFATNETATLFDTINQIAPFAFAGLDCERIVVPNSCVLIGNNSFENCANLKEVVLPNKLTAVAKETFKGCTSLEQADLPSSVETICSEAFKGCPLRKIYIGDKVKNIQELAFQASDNTKEIIVEKGNSSYSSLNNLLTDKTERVVILGTKDASIPEGIVYIKDNAFASLSIKSLVLPDSLVKIGDNSLSNTKLESVKFGKNIHNVCGTQFSNCNNLKTIEVSSENPFLKVVNNKVIDMPTSTLVLSNNEVAFIEDAVSYSHDCFDTVNYVKQLNVPDYLVDFSWENLSKLDIDSISVDKNNPVFDSRDNSNAVIDTSRNAIIFGTKNTVIPNTVTSIGPNAFMNNKGLTRIEIPSSIHSISFNSFYGAINLSEIIISEDNLVYTNYGSSLIAARKVNKVLFGTKDAIVPTTVFMYSSEFDKYDAIGQHNVLELYGRSRRTEVAEEKSTPKVVSNVFDGEDNLPF